MIEGRTSNAPRASTWWFPTAAILFTLLILGGTILAGRQYLEVQLRKQIAGRDARILHALWLAQLNAGTDELGLFNESPADHFVAVLEALRLQELRELRAARLYDASGGLIITLPAYVGGERLPKTTLEQLQTLEPVSHYRPRVDWNVELGVPPEIGFEEQKAGSALEIILPIRAPGESSLSGAVEFLLDGSSLTAEFDALARSLWGQAIAAFAVSGGIVLAGLALAFRRLQTVNRLLAERTQRLLRANQELTLAAKTSAVGAVTSHLIHGLKNPLSGLQSFISSRGGGHPGDNDQEWELAVSTARRMQNLVSEIVRVLREESSATQYELSLAELLEMVTSKARPAAEQAGVKFSARLVADGVVSNRNANLIILILDNLIQNAIQATPRGRSVAVRIETREGSVVCEVDDQGPGLPEHYRKHLFAPCQSTKEKGTGIGLAISKQLANYLGAELELKSSSPAGCIFALSVPPEVFTRSAEPAIADRGGAGDQRSTRIT